MTINRRHMALAGVGAVGVALLGRGALAAAEGPDEAAVKAAVEGFRKAMVANDRAQLEALTAPQLSYGHSAWKIQNKDEFIADVPKGTWKFINVSDETTSVVGNNAISRFTFVG